MKTKTFDCVKMKRKGAQKIYRDLKNKSVEEQIEYWRKRSEELRKDIGTYTNPDPS